MNKFKKGDRVIVLAGCSTTEAYGENIVGQLGTVNEYSDREDSWYDESGGEHSEFFIRVDMDIPYKRGPHALSWHDLDFFEHELEIYDDNL